MNVGIVAAGKGARLAPPIHAGVMVPGAVLRAFPAERIAASETELRPALLRVAGGAFTMGTDDPDPVAMESPPHSVTVGDFEICISEVARPQFIAAVGREPFECDDCETWAAADGVRLVDGCAYVRRPSPPS